MTPKPAPAPRKPRRPRGMVGCTLPPGALVLVDAMVGTFYGNTRSEVLRFITVSWLTEHIAAVSAITKDDDLEGR